MPNREVEILLVEDSEIDAEITIRALKKNNMANSIVHVSDGVQALDFLFGTGEYSNRNIKNKPKVVLLDVKMPKVDGIEVLEQIKSHPVMKKVPVVMLTSSNQYSDMERCYELGANSYIVKPVGFDKFMNAISQCGIYWLLINEPSEN